MTKRKILLFVGTLAMLTGACVTYWWFAARHHTVVVEQEPLDVDAGPTLTADQPAASLVGALKVGVGTEATVPIYDTVTERDARGREVTRRREAGQIHWKSQRPLGNGQFHLTGPKVWLFLKDGQLVYLEADEAVVSANEAAAQTLNPKRGTLSGHVKLVVDRNTSPDRLPPEQRPNDTIRIFLDQVEFDYPDNLIRTASRVRVESFEADVAGQGLLLRWDPVDKQIINLKLNTQAELADGGELPPAEMVIRQGAGFAQFGSPAGGRTAGAAPDAGAETARPAAPGTMARLASAAPPPPNPDDIHTYRATFHRDVRVVQGYDAAHPESIGQGQLFSDRTVTAIFDFTPPKERKASAAASASASASAEPPAGAGGRDATDAAAPGAENGPTVRVTWCGLLDMIPMDRADEPDRIVTGQRRELIGEGSNVVLMEADGKTAVCEKFAFDTETGVARLFGSAQRMVVMAEPDGRKVQCRSLVYDRGRNRVTMVGEGQMLTRGGGDAATLVQPGGRPLSLAENRALVDMTADDPQVVAIRWADHVEVVLANTLTRPAQFAGPPSTQPDAAGRDYLRQATFSGKVRMRQLNAFELEAHSITVYFHPPTDTMQPNQIEYIEAEGEMDRNKKFISKVKIVRTASEITSNRLVLYTKKEADGTTVPDKAVATGEVHGLMENGMELQNAERMELTFERSSGKKAGPGGAARTGLDGDGHYEPYEIQAFKDVVVVHPQRRLRAVGDHLYSVLGSDRATLTGAPARIELADRMISGSIIEMDQAHQSARVLGAGTMSFLSDRDLTGAPAATPVPIRAAWNLAMSYDSGANQAELRGDVRAEAARSTIRADLLRLYFQDKAPSPPPGGQPPPLIGPSADAASAPLAAGTASQPDSRQTVPAATGDAATASSSEPRAEARGRDATGAAAPAANKPTDPIGVGLAGKQVTRVIAERNAVVTTSELDPATGRLATRMRIAGDQLLFDSVSNQLDAAGAGQLLIEDYRPAEPAAEKGAAAPGRPGDPIDQAMRSRPNRPSQTAIAWERSMKSNPATLLATFSGQVRVRHRGPDALAVAPDGTVQADPRGPITTLDCDNLLIQFDGQPAAAPAPDRPTDRPAGGLMAQTARINDVRTVLATTAVHLVEGRRSVVGNKLEFLRTTNTITVEGTADQPARLFDIRPDGSSFNELRSPRIEWNRTTNEIRSGKTTFQGN